MWRLWRIAADLITVAHLAFLLLLLLSWLMPLWIQVAMIGLVLIPLIANNGKCWVTQLELRCRRCAYPGLYIRGESLVRRAIRWTTGVPVSELTATVITLAVITGLVISRFL